MNNIRLYINLKLTLIGSIKANVDKEFKIYLCVFVFYNLIKYAKN